MQRHRHGVEKVRVLRPAQKVHAALSHNGGVLVVGDHDQVAAPVPHIIGHVSRRHVKRGVGENDHAVSRHQPRQEHLNGVVVPQIDALIMYMKIRQAACQIVRGDLGHIMSEHQDVGRGGQHPGAALQSRQVDLLEHLVVVLRNVRAVAVHVVPLLLGNGRRHRLHEDVAHHGAHIMAEPLPHVDVVVRAHQLAEVQNTDLGHPGPLRQLPQRHVPRVHRVLQQVLPQPFLGGRQLQTSAFQICDELRI